MILKFCEISVVVVRFIYFDYYFAICRKEDNEIFGVCASFYFGSGLRNPLLQALPEVIILKLKDIPTLATSLDFLFTEAAQQRCGRQAILDRLIEVIIVQLLRDLMNENRLHVGLLTGLADPKLAKVINIIHSNPVHNWTLDDLVKVLYLKS